MEKIFYADNFPRSSDEAVKEILSTIFGIDEEIVRSKNGKPYLKSGKLFFSVTHTKNRLFIAFSSENVGIDAEHKTRKTNASALMKKFALEEQNSISSSADFLRLWTKKESVVKYVGGSIVKDLKKIVCLHDKAYFDGKELPCLLTELEFDGYILSVCGKNFQGVAPKNLLRRI